MIFGNIFNEEYKKNSKKILQSTDTKIANNYKQKT